VSGLSCPSCLSCSYAPRPLLWETHAKGLEEVTSVRTFVLLCTALGLLAAMPTATAQPADGNLIANGGFEVDADGDGLADGWTAPHDEGVDAAASLDVGATGEHSQKLACTRFERRSPSSHAMLAQTGHIAVAEGQWYRLRFKARQEGIPGGAIDVALRDTAGWTDLGLMKSARVKRTWTDCEFVFRSPRTVAATTRLQIWFMATGTLWLDDVSLTPTTGEARRCHFEIPETTRKNLVPNSSFECGAAGWGSISDVPGWGGNLNRLLGEVVSVPCPAGSKALEIALDRETVPICWFDYFELTRIPMMSVRAANRGWIPVEPGQPYTLSAYVRSEPAGLPVVLTQFRAFGGDERHAGEAAGEWSRVEWTFRPTTNQIFVGVGPDLNAAQLDRGTMWVDAVQLERGEAATAFEPRAQAELGVECEALGHLFDPGQRPELQLTLASPTPATARVSLKLTDYHDAACGEVSEELRTEAGEATSRTVRLPVEHRGFYRARISCDGAEVVPAEPLRLGIVEPYRAQDGPFAMNHGYPWGELLDLSGRIGIRWFRDWSLKWQDVEPEKGRFTFAEADAQIDRVLEHGLNVLPLIPYPSSNWASSGEPRPEDSRDYPAIRRLMALMPKDLKDAQDFIEAAVVHYRDRLHAWEILNEPIYTDYSLPRAEGYEVEDYVRYLAAASEAVKRADPKALVIGGIAGPPDLTFDEPLARLVERMDAAGRRVPIWFTEGAYYADDDPAETPWQSWLSLVDDEALCGAWMTKFSAMLMAYGTERIVWHSGTPGAVNRDEPAGIFFEWNGAPRKMLVSQAAISEIVGPGPLRGRGRLAAPESLYAYAFDSGERTIVVTWLNEDTAGEPATLRLDGPRAFDLIGNPLPGDAVTVGFEPVYLVFERVADDDELRGLVARAG